MGIVRTADGRDVTALAALAAATFPLACPPHLPAADIAALVGSMLTARRFEDYVRDPARAVLVVDGVADGSGASSGLLAYAMLVAGEPADPDVAAAVRLRPTVELSKFYVDPGAHGSGVAATLMGAAVARVRESGAAGIWLGVNEHNARANRFYDKHGFLRVGTRRFRVGTSLEHDYVRERTLSP